MKRNMPLIKAILKYVESEGTYPLTPLDDPTFEGFTDEQVGYHIALLEESGLVNVRKSANGARLTDLTWQGHDLLDKLCP